ncbi:hypothetical protein [Cohnella candidum]|uniref:Uncharacterized protein n=1 Tax=Cohnella candidum TaxID=2674991 RepID=A0A3G3K1N4_9BACL|nr:hypothetical protein [Cohnella candidum]AYQ74332.1 hypothetical protein EAV92_18220 [Cohnella candidum]
MKKIKQPGENFSLKTRKTEDPRVMQWINAQTNLMDSLRYLIENEIARNGVRNLQTVIPAERTLLQGSLPQQPAELPSAAPDAQQEPDLPPDEELDEEDIEAWI